VRTAVEHVFARQKGPMGLFIRTIGIARARTRIGLANLVYNMHRMGWLMGQAAAIYINPNLPLKKPEPVSHEGRFTATAKHPALYGRQHGTWRSPARLE